MADLNRAIFARKITELSPETELTRFRGKSRKSLNCQQIRASLQNLHIKTLYIILRSQIIIEINSEKTNHS
jgi:hypothetical protein